MIREKKLEREVLFPQLEDERFLLKTQKLYQPLFYIIIQELGHLIVEDRQREIFLAISCGEAISIVAKRYGLTYAKAVAMYSFILKKLNEYTGRIATFRNLAMKYRFGESIATYPTNIPISSILDLHGCNVLRYQAEISTVHELLQYTSQYDWCSLKSFRGLGETTYHRMLDALEAAGFIMVHKDGSVELTPEIAALII